MRILREHYVRVTVTRIPAHTMRRCSAGVVLALAAALTACSAKKKLPRRRRPCRSKSLR